ncbi:MAG: cyclic nucleotide-binding domain-containing protein [Deltaproteobacteria bacterium]|nr:cyclic nucleotide-binding domain-containing protein [Deltaproteobacteria bacterium]
MGLLMSAEMLKRCVLFKDFTPVGLDILARIAKPRIVLAGKPLFIEGSASETLVIVVEGRFQVLVKGTDGRDTPLASLGPGEHLGDLSLLAAGRKATHLVTVVAEADSRVVELSQGDFLALSKEKPQACMKLVLALASEVGRKTADAREPLKLLLSRAAVR